MNQVGTALERLVTQENTLNTITNLENALIYQQNEQDGRMTDLARTDGASPPIGIGSNKDRTGYNERGWGKETAVVGRAYSCLLMH